MTLPGFALSFLALALGLCVATLGLCVLALRFLVLAAKGGHDFGMAALAGEVAVVHHPDAPGNQPTLRTPDHQRHADPRHVRPVGRRIGGYGLQGGDGFAVASSRTSGSIGGVQECGFPKNVASQCCAFQVIFCQEPTWVCKT